MTDYKEHIEAFEYYKRTGLLLHSAIDAAVDLMRAAQPKDEAAEGEHCESVGKAWLRQKDVSVVGLIARERAAARAEGDVMAAFNGASAKHWAKECDRVTAKLTALQDTSNVLRDAADRVVDYYDGKISVLYLSTLRAAIEASK
jgi:hypothetical protein